MRSIGRAVQFGGMLWRTYGWRGLSRRATHETRRMLGLYRAEPHSVEGSGGESTRVYAPRNYFATLSDATRARIIDRGKRVVDGSYEAFGQTWRSFPVDAAAWQTTPDGSFRFPNGPWWTIPHLPRGADIKEVWEPARFGWVYDLVRAHHLTSDPACATTFHRRFREWAEASPPFDGVHWSCGQETSIRAIALLHGESVFGPGADAKLERVLAWSAERIADAIDYGLSQRNNHGISEAAGLIHLGARLARHPRAASWLRLGTRLLEEQILDQFLEDGWYAQHSFNYLRVAMEQAVLAQRVLQAHCHSLNRDALARLGAAFDLVAATIDGATGTMPNFGANDGARILPLSSAPYADFRPMLTLASLVLARPLPQDVLPDPEVLAWIGGTLPQAAAPREDGVWRGRASGWIVVRRGTTSAFVRAGELRHRPSHLDQLHLSVKNDGRDVIVDPGTYAYNARAPWNNGLAVARVHNAPLLDDREPGRKGPRFLWADWPSAHWREIREEQGSVVLVGESPTRVRRSIVVGPDGIRVRDEALDVDARTMSVTWLKAADSNGIVEADGAEALPRREDAVDGWYAPSYLHRVPAQAYRIRRDRRAGMPLEIETHIRWNGDNP